MPEEIDIHKPETASEPQVVHQAPSAIPSTRRPKAPVKLLLLPVGLTILLAVAIYFFAPHRAEQDFRKRPKTVPVTVAVAKSQSVPITIRTTGNVTPYSMVNVVPQVSGQLQRVFFTQGQMVKKGDLLFQIDPRQYQATLGQALGNVAKDRAQLDAAKANLARDQANVGQLEANMRKDQASLDYANLEFQRYRKLVQAGAISMEQADQAHTSARTAEATIAADKKQIENAKAVINADLAQIETAKGTVQADQAAADNARLQVEFCQIRSPMDGRTGSLNVYEGNVVAANNATPLVSIAQITPIYISFTVPEEYLDQVRHCLAEKTLKIEALIEGKKANSVLGSASFLENTVNTSSGTALLRATFDNKDLQLFPGQFVDVVVTMPADGVTTVVPAAAVQTTQKGNAVYVVGPDNKVKLVPVELKRTFDDSAAIGSGVNPGDVVVTDGQLQLIPGASVRVVQDNGGAGGGGGRHHRGGGGNGGPPDESAQSSDQSADGQAAPTANDSQGQAGGSASGSAGDSASGSAAGSAGGFNGWGGGGVERGFGGGSHRHRQGAGNWSGGGGGNGSGNWGGGNGQHHWRGGEN